VREQPPFSAPAPDEIETGVHYLSGELPQGRIGMGTQALRTALNPPLHATLTVPR